MRLQIATALTFILFYNIPIASLQELAEKPIGLYSHF